MRVVAGGSRGWRDKAAIRERLAKFPPGTVVIHGGARGADHLIDLVARALGFTVLVFPVTDADWRPLGPSGPFNARAGHMRNGKMLDELDPPPADDLVLAFWDGQSTGTAGLIREARRRGLAVEVVPG